MIKSAKIELQVGRPRSVPFSRCPSCGARFVPMMRGQVVELWRVMLNWFGLRLKTICLICRRCKEVVGHEE